jgi:integrase
MADTFGDMAGPERKALQSTGSNAPRVELTTRRPRGRSDGWKTWAEIKKMAQVPTISPRRIGPRCEIHCTRPGTTSVSFRYRFGDKDRRKVVGQYKDFTALAELQQVVEANHYKVRHGVDPLEEDAAAEQAAAAEQTFAQVAERHIAAHEAAWRNPKHRQQWRNTVAGVLPILGELPIKDIRIDHVLKVLEPLWAKTPETASRLRGRIEAIIDLAIARGWYDRENPARWRLLKATLPAARKLKPITHYSALPWKEIPSFMARLQGQAGMSAKGLAFGILTACRSGEVRGARWREISPDAVWTIPAERTKTRKEHKVPLSAGALAVLEEVRPLRRSDGDLVFPGLKVGVSLSDMSLAAVLKRMGDGQYTVHGMRSCFRDWAAETTSFDNHVVEMALGHAINSAVEAAYRRGDLITKRTELMAAWATFCTEGRVT